MVRQSQKNRFASVELVDEVIALDDVGEGEEANSLHGRRVA